jgi:hypothetical protein
MNFGWGTGAMGRVIDYWGGVQTLSVWIRRISVPPKVGYYQTKDAIVGGYDAQFGLAGPRYGQMAPRDASALFGKIRSALDDFRKTGCCQ